MTNRKQDALGLAAVGVLLLIASGEGFLLLRGLQFRQQKSMAHADLVLREGFDHCGGKLDQFQSSEDVCRGLATLGGNLFDAVLRFFKAHQRGEAVGLVERMHVAALQVFNDAGFEGLGVGQFDDADRRGFESGQLRRAVAPRSGDDLEVLAHGPHDAGAKARLAF